MPGSDATVVVVPRERFSYTRESLEALLANTPQISKLVYVDGGSPLEIRRYLEARAEEVGFTYIRSARFLSPNEARNIGLRHVGTTYAVFVDNDVVPSPGWLEPLVACANETGAAIVGPLYLIDVGGKRSIHMAGGDARIAVERGRRICVERHRHSGAAPSLAAKLGRVACDVVEFHAMLVRTQFLKQTHGFDERMLSVNEHVDLCMKAREAGHGVYFEPCSVVTYVPAERLSLSDMRYFMLRWSERWNRASATHFNAKWNLDQNDPRNRGIVKFGRHHRCRGLRLIRDRAASSRLLWTQRRVIVFAERCFNVGYTTCRFDVRRAMPEGRRRAAK